MLLGLRLGPERDGRIDLPRSQAERLLRRRDGLSRARVDESCFDGGADRRAGAGHCYAAALRHHRLHRRPRVPGRFSWNGWQPRAKLVVLEVQDEDRAVRIHFDDLATP